MKTAQQTRTSIDRISTHEELHQVLALVSESVPQLIIETSSETDEQKALQQAVADLWRDDAADENGGPSDEHGENGDVQEQMYQWAEMLAGRAEHVN